MKLYQAELVPVSSDEDGMNMEDLEEKIRACRPKMIYTIPTFQNPTGRTMSLEKRKKVAALAERYGVVVAEDDPYHDLRYTGQELPTIKSFDEAGFVVFLGSFSKVISPGLRVGFMAAEPGLLRKCVIAKQSSDLHTALLNQAICAEYIRQGLLAPHIEAICRSYSVQLETMLSGIGQINAFTWVTRPEGGLFIFAALKEGLDALALLPKAVDAGVAYVPGTHFYAGGGHENTLRLNFSMAEPETIRKGLALLQGVLDNA
jgi:2-aminoadipate transaminase